MRLLVVRSERFARPNGHASFQGEAQARRGFGGRRRKSCPSHRRFGDRAAPIRPFALFMGPVARKAGNVRDLSELAASMEVDAANAPQELMAEYRRLAIQIASQRERAAQLRMLGEHADAQADRDERVLNDIASVVGIAAQLRIVYLDPRLEQIAISLLRERARESPIHYRDWFGLLREAGHHLGGKGPLATFLAQIKPRVRQAVSSCKQRLSRARMVCRWGPPCIAYLVLNCCAS